MTHPVVGEVELSGSLRARRISLRITALGRVRLTIPRGVPVDTALRFMESQTEWIARAKVRMAERKSLHEPALRSDMTEEERHLRIEQLRRDARTDLPLRLHRISQQTGLAYSSVNLRIARSRWGSCSARNAISLNIALMILPEHLRDFVLIHELCHTREHNHSPRFHALVNRFTEGRERELERELRTYHIFG